MQRLQECRQGQTRICNNTASYMCPGTRGCSAPVAGGQVGGAAAQDAQQRGQAPGLHRGARLPQQRQQQRHCVRVGHLLAGALRLVRRLRASAMRCEFQ